MAIAANTPKLPNNPDNYVLPSGLSIWFAPKESDGGIGTWRDLGNCTNVALTLTEEFLEHMSARYGVNSADKRIVNALRGEVKFTLDELVGCNLLFYARPKTAPDTTKTIYVLQQKRIVLSGTTAEIIDAAATEQSDTDYEDLLWDDGTGTYVSGILVRSADGVTTYTSGVDYTFTQASGSGSGSGRTAATIARIALGSIPDGSEVVVTYAYEREVTEYVLQEGVVLEGALRVQVLSSNGPMYAWQFNFVSIRPDGDLTLNPAAYMSANFIADVLTDGQGNRGSMYIFDRYARAAAAQSC